MWNGGIAEESLRHALLAGQAYKRSGPGGLIHNANVEFCNLLGYTEYELKTMGWIALSLKGAELDADLAEVESVVKGEKTGFQVYKTYVHKNGTPVPGLLKAIRYPLTGEFEYFHCWFIPFMNGSKAALELTMSMITKTNEIIENNTLAISELKEDSRRNNSPGSRIIWAVHDLYEKYPKRFWTVLVTLALLDPREAVRIYATQLGLFPSQPVELKLRDEGGKEMKVDSKDDLHAAVRQYNLPIAEEMAAPVVSTRSISLPNGSTLSWGLNDGMRSGAERIGRSDFGRYPIHRAYPVPNGATDSVYGEPPSGAEPRGAPIPF